MPVKVIAVASRKEEELFFASALIKAAGHMDATKTGQRTERKTGYRETRRNKTVPIKS